MLQINFVTKTNDPFGEILRDINNFADTKRKEADLIGGATSDKMKELINNGKLRPQSDEPTTLEAAINVEFFENGWGVGDITRLNNEAKYWAALNFGSAHMVGKHLPVGVFNPGEPSPNNTFFRKGRWKKGEKYNNESYSPMVKKPIPALNYIEQTIFWLDNKINELRGK